MERMSMVETLRDKTNVTYEEARDALERADWDLLEAVVLLERDGKVEQKKEEPKMEQQQTNKGAGINTEKASQAMENVGNAIGGLVDKGNRKHLEVYKANRTTLSIPLTVLALLLVFTFWITVPAAVVAWLVGYRFRIVDKAAKDNQVDQPQA